MHALFGIDGVVADEADREGAPPLGRVVGRCAVYRPVGKGDGITGLHRPAADVVVAAVRGNIGYPLAGVARSERRAVEPFGPELAAPPVGAGDIFDHAVARHRIERDPQAAVHPALDAVVGHVVMPGCDDRRTRLLDQDVLVEQARRLRSHQPGGGFSGWRLLHESVVFRNLVPVAEVLEEGRAAVVRLDAALAPARRGHIGFHAAAQVVDPVGEGTPEQQDAVPLELVHLPVGDGRAAGGHLVLLVAPAPAGPAAGFRIRRMYVKSGGIAWPLTCIYNLISIAKTPRRGVGGATW